MRTTVRAVTAALALLGALVLLRPQAASAAGARDITAFACPPDAVRSPFTDTAGSSHRFAIDCLFTYGITRGTSATTYSPDAVVTRGQTATFLFAILSSAGVEMDSADRGFTDVAGSVHEDHINAVASVRVLYGTTPTTFEPDVPVTRAQMASLLTRALATTGIAIEIGPDAFADDNGSVHESAIDALAYNGIVAGVGGRRYDPSGQVRRGSMAAFLMRATDFGIEHGGVPSTFETSRRWTAMSPAQVAIPDAGEADASGTGSVWTIGRPGVVCFEMATRNVGSGQDGVERVAYLARGARGEVGEILVELPPPTPANNSPFVAAHAYSAGCVRTTDEVMAAVVDDPESLYLGLATFEHEEALRGQLGVTAHRLVADLTGDTTGRGAVVVTITSQPDHLCWSLRLDGVDGVTAVHLHGDEDVVALAPAPGADGEVAWCAAGLDPATVAAVATAPAQHHVDVHTTAHPTGALQGQLQPSPTA